MRYETEAVFSQNGFQQNLLRHRRISRVFEKQLIASLLLGTVSIAEPLQNRQHAQNT